MKWVERANIVAARARTLPEEQLPPAYRPFIKVMQVQATQTQEFYSKVGGGQQIDYNRCVAFSVFKYRVSFQQAIAQLQVLCVASPELSSAAQSQPTKSTKSAQEFCWITVVRLVDFVSKEHTLQRQRLQMHKWLTNHFSIVDSNRDRFISREEFVRMFSGPDISDATKFPTARELGAFFTNAIHGASDVQEMSFSLFSSTVCQYLEAFLDRE